MSPTISDPADSAASPAPLPDGPYTVSPIFIGYCFKRDVEVKYQGRTVAVFDVDLGGVGLAEWFAMRMNESAARRAAGEEQAGVPVVVDAGRDWAGMRRS